MITSFLSSPFTIHDLNYLVVDAAKSSFCKGSHKLLSILMTEWWNFTEHCSFLNIYFKFLSDQHKTKSKFFLSHRPGIMWKKLKTARIRSEKH